MSEIGVFHANEFNSTFFTRCCEVAICDNQENCPKCGKKVIPHKDRWECAFGPHRRRIEAYHTQRRKENGLDTAARCTARLLGERFVPPRLCLMCGKPVSECYC